MRSAHLDSHRLSARVSGRNQQEAACASSTLLFVIHTAVAMAIVMFANVNREPAMLIIVVMPETD